MVQHFKDVDIDAPKQGRPVTRVKWLLRQLSAAPDAVRVEAFEARSRGAGTAVLLRDAREDPAKLIANPTKELRAFRVALTTPSGTKRGRGRGAIPHRGGLFDLDFDFVDHCLRLRSSDGGERLVGLSSRPVADFYEETMAALGALDLEVTIDPRPNEVDPAVPFNQDHHHATYDPQAARIFWHQLMQADRGLGGFRSHFVGKVSPVHFFWGAMDLACTRFSGREAPEHPGGAPNCGDWVMVEVPGRRRPWRMGPREARGRPGSVAPAQARTPATASQPSASSRASKV